MKLDIKGIIRFKIINIFIADKMYKKFHNELDV